MIGVKKYRYKPVYKKFTILRNNVQNRQKLLKFKRQKWKNLLFSLKKVSKNKKRNSYYKFYDQNSYKKLRYRNYFSKSYKQSVLNKKLFNLFYGTLNKKYLKKLIKKSIKFSNQLQNKINYNLFFLNLIEKRLDVILLRSNFVLSIRNARQLVNHKHVYINNKVVNSSSFLLKRGDKITFSNIVCKKIKLYVALSDLWPIPPSYLQVNYKIFQIRVIDEILLSNYSSSILVWLNLQNVTKNYIK